MIDQLISLPLNEKIGQLFFIGIAGADLDEQTRDLIAEVSPGGICFFSRNIRERKQTRQLLDDIRRTSTVMPFLSIDQEGGLVDRLRRIMAPMPAPATLATKDDADRLAAIIAEALGILGFNMDFAPVVDVIDADRAKYTNGLFSRTFGDSAEEVAAFAISFLRTLQANGIIGCPKHFPGLGASRVDSHEALPTVDISEAEFDAVDLLPYRELLASAEVRAIMAAHATFPNSNLQETDQNGKLLPSSLSYSFITNLLRNQLSFNGLVITDDLEMGAIIGNCGIGDASKMAIAAGVDMLAICAGPEAVREGFTSVLRAAESGEISIGRIDESLRRIGRLKAELPEPPSFDPSRLDSLSAEIADLGNI